MTDPRAEANAQQFDQIAADYDALGFLTQAAHALAAAVFVPAGGRVLDVATGTGTVALALAERAERVVGSDISTEMLKQAKRRAQRFANVEFIQADASALPLPDASFVVVVCGAGLFFASDMVAALREWRRVLKPGGEVVFSAFGRGLLGPLPGLWRETLAGEGVKPGAPPLGRIGTPQAAQELLEQAGYAQVSARLTTLNYTLLSPAHRWADIAAGLEGLPLSTFSPQQLARVQVQHLEALGPLFAAGPLTVPIPLLVARGRG